MSFYFSFGCHSTQKKYGLHTTLGLTTQFALECLNVLNAVQVNAVKLVGRFKINCTTEHTHNWNMVYGWVFSQMMNETANGISTDDPELLWIALSTNWVHDVWSACVLSSWWWIQGNAFDMAPYHNRCFPFLISISCGIFVVCVYTDHIIKLINFEAF